MTYKNISQCANIIARYMDEFGGEPATNIEWISTQLEEAVEYLKLSPGAVVSCNFRGCMKDACGSLPVLIEFGTDPLSNGVSMNIRRLHGL